MHQLVRSFAATLGPIGVQQSQLRIIMWVYVMQSSDKLYIWPEEPVRLLWFWLDQYFKLQQYVFNKT